MKDIPRHSGSTDVTPEEAGFHSPRLDALDSFFARLIEKKRLQAAGFLLARRGKIFASRTLGSLAPDDPGRSFLPDSLLAVGPITQAVTAVALFTLMEAGRLTLEQPVSRMIKEFDTDQHRKIAVSHLLNHTAGLAPDAGFFHEPNPARAPRFRNMRDFLRHALRGPLLAPPGERWAPCANGFVVLGEIIERVSGVTYEDYVRRAVLEPLGMGDTHFTVPEEKRDRLCRTGKRMSSRGKGKNIQAADSGLHSTLPDLFKFGRMMLGNGRLGDARVISRKSVEKMTSNRLRHLSAEEGAMRLDPKKYGFGWSILSLSIVSPSAFGLEAPGRASLLIDPEEDLAAVFFTPAAGPPAPEALTVPPAVVWSGLE
ncbi:MAG: beta-lactamase family protein [Spirochaetales bacterium]|nr:beta-lactamase family protein [Spirochaetales bacterium]